LILNSLKEKIFIAGHNGMVGKACLKKIKSLNTYDIIFQDSQKLDLRDYESVKNFFIENKPDIIINAAARVGGIHANSTYPFQFISENLIMQYNLIKLAHDFNIKKFIFLGSSCIYPKFSKQPITENSLLTGSLEQTNEWYAIAKIAGIKMIESLRNQFNRDYVSLMPTNLYGPHDNFDLKTSHVLPSLIRKFHDAKITNSNTVELWGSGTPLREFMHVDDLADSIIFCLQKTLPHSIYNIGFGKEISISDLALMVKDLIGFKGKIEWNSTMPDGTPRKLMDSSRINQLGWKPKINLKDGIKETYNWYLSNLNNLKFSSID